MFPLLTEAVPLFWNQTASDQIHFLCAIQGMGSLDLLRKDASGDPEIGNAPKWPRAWTETTAAASPTRAPLAEKLLKGR